MMASERDPHGIVPDGFWELYDSIDEAKRKHSSTDFESERRCPECDSYRWMAKQDDLRKQSNRQPEPYRCRNCSHHFWVPSEPGESKEGEE